MSPRSNDPAYRAGMAADRLRRRAEKRLREGRASRAVALLARALKLASGRESCRLLRIELHPLWAVAFAAAEGQETIRRELESYHRDGLAA
jgi:hypothetical protein